MCSKMEPVVFPCGSLDGVKPPGGDLADNLEHGVAPAWFDEIIGGAQFGGTLFVRGIFGARKDNDRKLFQSRCGPNPSEEIKAINARHLKINDEEIGGRMTVSVGVRRFAFQIINGLLSILDELNFMLEAKKGTRVFENESVVTIIFGDEYRSFYLHDPFETHARATKTCDCFCAFKLCRSGTKRQLGFSSVC